MKLNVGSRKPTNSYWLVNFRLRKEHAFHLKLMIVNYYKPTMPWYENSPAKRISFNELKRHGLKMYKKMIIGRKFP